MCFRVFRWEGYESLDMFGDNNGIVVILGLANCME